MAVRDSQSSGNRKNLFKAKFLFKPHASHSLRTPVVRTSIAAAFANLDRKVRQELAAIDGATIISHTGEILAVGAILKVPGGSAGGGGRLAAAKALAAYGLGIKVSQDGSITGYRRDKTDAAFRIM